MRPIRVIDRSRWAPLAASTGAAAVLCGVLAYWAMVLLAPRVAIAPADTLIDRAAPSDLGPVQRLFGQIAGAQAAAELPPSNIQVHGILAAGGKGAAILSVDGKPPRAFGIGDMVAEGLKLTSVGATEVVLERDGVKQRLPAPPGADLAVLTRGPGPGGTVATPAPPSAFAAPPAPAVAPVPVRAPAPAPQPAGAAAPPAPGVPLAAAPAAPAAPAAVAQPAIVRPATPPPAAAPVPAEVLRGIRRGRSARGGGDEE